MAFQVNLDGETNLKTRRPVLDLNASTVMTGSSSGLEGQPEGGTTDTSAGAALSSTAAEGTGSGGGGLLEESELALKAAVDKVHSMCLLLCITGVYKSTEYLLSNLGASRCMQLTLCRGACAWV